MLRLARYESNWFIPLASELIRQRKAKISIRASSLACFHALTKYFFVLELDASSFSDALTCISEIDRHLVTHRFKEAIAMLRACRNFFQQSRKPMINLLFNGKHITHVRKVSWLQPMFHFLKSKVKLTKKSSFLAFEFACLLKIE